MEFTRRAIDSGPHRATSTLPCMRLCARCKITRFDAPVVRDPRAGIVSRVIQIPPFKLRDLAEGCSFCDLIKAVVSIDFPGASESHFIVFNEGSEGKVFPDLYVAMATEKILAAYPAPISSLASMKPDRMYQYLKGPDEKMLLFPYVFIRREDDQRIISTAKPLALLDPREQLVASPARRTSGVLLAPPKRRVASQVRRTGRSLACPYDNSRINFSKLNSWVSECCNANDQSGLGHTRCNVPKSSMDFMTIRLIDCKTRKIVLHDQNMPYIALSYVWGGTVHGIERSTKARFRLPATVPQTIVDAMVVVRSLEMQYLWVDRYCILEEDDKLLQIRNMHLIYGNAFCTIIALEGVDAEAGLPGVSYDRPKQRHSHTERGTYFTTFPFVNEEIEESRWAQRGWTYQEFILSRRCLLFNRNQVLFVCKESIHESIPKNIPKDMIEENEWFASRSAERKPKFETSYYNLPIKLFKAIGDDNTHDKTEMLQRFNNHLAGYTNRSLTYDYDAINAFGGILSSFSSFYFWGTPILPRSYLTGADINRVLESRMNIAFISGLVWKRHGFLAEGTVLKRRPDFPSWCWASVPVRTELLDPDYGPWEREKLCWIFSLQVKIPDEEKTSLLGVHDWGLQSLQVKTPDGEKTSLLGLHAWWNRESPRRNLDVNFTIELTVDVAEVKLVDDMVHCCQNWEISSADHVHAYVRSRFQGKVDHEILGCCLGEAVLDMYDEVQPQFLCEKLYVVRLWEGSSYLRLSLQGLIISWDGSEDSVAYRVGILINRTYRSTWSSSLASLQKYTFPDEHESTEEESWENKRWWTRRKVTIN